MHYIFHIDINAFYATVEEILNPKLKNLPIVVGGRTKRSVVSSANYLARNLGIKAAMPIFMAKKLCPHLEVVDPHFKAYEEHSIKFHNFISSHFTNKIEQFSIDECWIDVTHLCKDNDSAIKLAHTIQKRIYRELQLPVSIGVSYNKFLAKMASDLKKPLGISTILNLEDIKNKLWNLPVDDMLFIGSASAKTLKENNINTIGDIANRDNNKILAKVLNKNWYVHYLHANGKGEYKLDNSKNIPKSISNSTTFLEDADEPEDILKTLKHLTQDAVERLQYYDLKTKTISVYVKYPDFKTVSKSQTFNKPFKDYEEIVDKAIKIFLENFKNQKIRLVGVGLNNLSSITEKTDLNPSIFNPTGHVPEIIEKTDLEKVKETVNKKMNLEILQFADKKL